MFGFRSNHETGNVLDEKQRRLMPAAGFDEVSNLLGRFSVDDAAESRRTTSRRANHPPIVYGNPHLNPTKPRMTGDQLFRILPFKPFEATPLQRTTRQLP